MVLCLALLLAVYTPSVSMICLVSGDCVEIVVTECLSHSLSKVVTDTVVLRKQNSEYYTKGSTASDEQCKIYFFFAEVICQSAEPLTNQGIQAFGLNSYC